MKIYLPDNPKTPKHQQALSWLHSWGVEAGWGYDEQNRTNYINFKPPKKFPKRRDFFNMLHLGLNPELSVLCYCGEWHKADNGVASYIILECPECHNKIKFCNVCAEHHLDNEALSDAFTCPYCQPVDPY